MRKAVLTAAVATSCLLALSACGSNSTDEGTDGLPPATSTTASASATASESASASASTSATASATASPTASVKQITLTVKDGKVSGDTGIVKLKVDEPFQVTVTSDVADEVHVHSETRAGFGADVAAGGTVTIDAVIKAPGEYEIELEGRKLTLARTQVT